MPELAIDAPPQGIISTGEYKDKAQTNIGMGFIGPTVLSKDIYATEVLTEILSGQGGRLFIELRDKRASPTRSPPSQGPASSRELSACISEPRPAKRSGDNRHHGRIKKR